MEHKSIVSKTRDQKLNYIYSLIGVCYSDIIEKSGEHITVDFTLNKNINDEIIVSHQEFFFSNESHIINYAGKFGIRKLLDLCEICGKNLEDVIDCNKIISAVALPKDDDLVYVVEKLRNTIDYHRLSGRIVAHIYNSRSDDQYTLTIGLCNEAGISNQEHNENLAKYIDIEKNKWPKLVISQCLMSLKIIGIELDYNKLVNIVSNVISPWCFNGSSAPKWVTKENLDYSQTSVIKFVLYTSGCNVPKLMKTLLELKTSGFYNECDQEHVACVIECVKNICDHNKFDDWVGFFDDFIPYGIDFRQVFDDYVDGTGNLDIFDETKPSKRLIEYLARIKGLIK
jgi:hypothetical protein